MSETASPTASAVQQPPLRRRRSRWAGEGTLTHPAPVGVAFVLPALVLIVTFVIAPLIFALYISLTDWPLIGSYEFVGLRNYANIFADTGFHRAVGYTLLYTAIVTLPILVVGYLMAVVVRANRPGSGVLRTIFFLPYVIGLSTLSFMLLLEVQPGSGAVNLILKWLGVTDGMTAWLVDGPLATGLICVLVIWGVSGLTMLLLISGMQGISKDIYESATLDGASWFRIEREITIPMLRQPIAMSLIISVIGSFLAFTQFFVLTQGGPGSDTTPIVLYVYQRAFVQLQVGAGTAQSVVLVIVVALITALQFRLLKEKD